MSQAVTNGAETPAKPAPTFDALPLGAEVRKAVDALGYTHPTPVQLAVFEPASRGKNLVVQARTGTGKTAAFGLPIVDALVRKSEKRVQALILTPTRELALQVAREIERLGQFRGVSIVPIYGGAPIGRQVSALEGGAQVVVGTPGRVLDHLRRGTLDPSAIRIFVLDEADEMLSMGFAKELNAIIETLPEERQGLYFSATIPPDVERLASNHLRDPEYVTLSSDQIGALEISHFVYLVREGDKRNALARIIEVEDPESAVVFCNTREETERIAELLKSRGYDADWLNGDLEQRERERVMAATREGKLRFLVATDVAARGIDISHLTHVINADFPESAEQYVHRTGRTGRAGRTGTAISVVGPKDVGHLYMLRLTYKIRPIERMLPTQGELRTRAEADMIAFLADAYAGKAQDPQHMAVARRLLTHDQAEIVIAGLLADHLGASAKDDAADARRAKNPPPEAPRKETRIGPDGEPHTLRDGEKPVGERAERSRRGRGEREMRPARDERADRPARNDRPVRDARADRPARDERARDSAEPRTGQRERPPVKALANWEPPSENDDDAPLFTGEPGTRPGLGHARPVRARTDEVDSAEAETIDIGRPALPQYHVEDEPTQVFDRAKRRPTRDAAEPEDDPAFANVFLNVGRRDGLRADDVQRLLLEKAKLDPADVGHVRLRDRMTFVGIRREHAETAMKALVGTLVGERKLNAELAKAKP
jgi:ATP-dependent RNA helicase DeaD